VLFGALGEDGPLMDVLYASCALPLYLPPQTIGGRRLGEGGLRAVLGLDAARRVPADLVMVVDVGPGFDEPPATKQAAVPPLVAGARRGDPRDDGRADGARHRGVAQRRAETGRGAGRGGREATFDVSSGQRFFDAGYRETKRPSADTLPTMLAREIMIPEPFVAAAGATSAEVALLMRAKDISGRAGGG